jgi:hypothetical protein
MEPKPAIRVPTRFGAETAAQRDQNHVTSMTCRIRPGQISPKYAQRPQTQGGGHGDPDAANTLGDDGADF